MPPSAAKATTTWLIDKSAYVRLEQATDPDAWVERIDRGLIRISTVTRLELGYSARTASDLRSELAGLTVLHVDKDLELIATITGQPHERLTI